MSNLEKIIEIPSAYQFLFRDYRYKCAYGGRGAGRSWSFARALLVRAMQKKTRICCFREIQKSIKDSIHRLLADQISILGLGSFFNINNTTITAVNGSEFLFEGLRSNINKIKSLEGIDIADIEEAETITAWDILLPTIRKVKSEIWLRFNTRYSDDETYQRFVVNPPTQSVVVKTSYRDNPYFTTVLDNERKQDLAYRPTEYKNIWEGDPIGIGRRVWPEFDESIHIREYAWKTVQDNANCFMSIDPASHYYPACLWIALMPLPGTIDMVKWVYAEYPQVKDLGDHFYKLRTRMLYTGSLSDLSREIYSRDGAGVKIVSRSIDSRFAKGSGSGSYVNDSQGMVQEMSKRENGGMTFVLPPEIIIDSMRSRIKDDLQWNTLQEFSIANSPHLYIAPWCTNLIESMKNHRLEEGAEKEDAKYKDFSDALRIGYAGMDGHKWKNPLIVKQEEVKTHYNNFSGTENQSVGWMS